MAKVEEDLKVHHHSPSSGPPSQQCLPFVEVMCKKSGKIRRFSIGTEAGFAVNLMNKKFESEAGLAIPLASHIEAVKEGEEPVSFGPNSLLVDYGPGWNLQTVIDTEGVEKGVIVATRRVKSADDKVIDDSNTLQKRSQPAISFSYIGKILLAFVLIFIFGAIFTLLLENLPQLILYINSGNALEICFATLCESSGMVKQFDRNPENVFNTRRILDWKGHRLPIRANLRLTLQDLVEPEA